MKPKIFISGKITGDPMYKAKFAEAENFYKKRVTSCLTLLYCQAVCNPQTICVFALR